MVEGKIERSFRNVKRDITSLREQLSRISEQQGDLMNSVLSLKAQKKEKSAKPKKKKRYSKSH